MIRVFIVDDFAPWRRYVTALLQTDRNISVIGCSGDGLDAVAKCKDLRPDVVLLDVSLPGCNGFDAARQIHEHSTGIRIVFCTQFTDCEFVIAAFALGAAGFVVKSSAGCELLPAIHVANRKQRYLSPSLHDCSPNVVLREYLTGCY